MKELWLDL